MPTYDYICQACDHAFEEFQSITAKPLRKCPVCGKPKLKRLIGIGAGIIFKGSGFYETDYRSEHYKSAAKADSEKASAKTETAAAGKSDGEKSAAAGKSDSATPKSDAIASGGKSESSTKTDTPSAKVPAPSESRSAGKSGSSRSGSSHGRKSR